MAHAQRRQHFPADVVRQLEEPLHFVDFLREPVTDAETGEVLDAHPSFYESVAGGLPDIRRGHALHARAAVRAAHARQHARDSVRCCSGP